MAEKTKNGWVAPISGWQTQARQKPAGILIDGGRGNVWLNYAGMGDAPRDGFELPSDPEMLRDIAEAIRRFADDL